MTVGSLFSGIGGIDLGLERCGYEVRWQCEIDPYCRRVLAKHWPDIPCHEDVRGLGAENLEPVDVLAGGFPCQPVSIAGKQLAQDDERWLWPEFARLVGELRPRHVFVENVPGILVRGFGDVLKDLAALGYDAEWGCVSAEGVGAPHLRKRIFLLAHTGSGELRNESRWRNGSRGAGAAVSGYNGTTGKVADTDSSGLQRPVRSRSARAERSSSRHATQCGDETMADTDSRRSFGRGQQERTEQQSERGGELNGRSIDGRLEYAALGGQWDVEPSVGRVAHGVPRRVDRLRALGNAVVPQVAEYVGRRLMEFA
jgi:DNA (cytosine-5)-methyltransferase 1